MGPTLTSGSKLCRRTEWSIAWYQFGTATNADGTSGSTSGPTKREPCPFTRATTAGDGAQQRVRYWGSFRIPNVRNFNVYVGNKFYDPTFYAPKDTIVLDAITNRVKTAPTVLMTLRNTVLPTSPTRGGSSRPGAAIACLQPECLPLK